MPDASRPSWLQRVGWLVLLWASGVAAVALMAWLLRLLMQGVGFSPTV